MTGLLTLKGDISTLYCSLENITFAFFFIVAKRAQAGTSILLSILPLSFRRYTKSNPPSLKKAKF